MARLIGPSEASREVKTIVTTSGMTKNLFKSKALRPAEYYTDPDPTAAPSADMLTERADILTLDGDAIADGTVTIDAYSMLPLMQFPDGADSVLVVIDNGPPWRVYAREDDQLDALQSAVAELQEPGAVGTTAIADDAVTAAKIAAGAVGTSELADDAVTAAKIAADAVGTSEIAADAVTSAEIAAGAVGASEIADGAVGTAELADDSVTAAKIASDAIGTSEIANDAVTAAKIAADAVGTSEIAADAVTSSEIAAAAVGTAELADGSVTSAKIVDGTIVDGDIAPAAEIAQSKISGLGAAFTAIWDYLANLVLSIAGKVAKGDLLVNVRDFGAVGDGRRVTDAAMTATSATLTSATAAFTAGDVGKRCIVWHAGTTVNSYTVGVAQQLDTTIVAYVNSTTVTLAVAAVTTVSGARASIATDDSAAVNAATATLTKGKELHFPGSTGFYLIRNRIVPPVDGVTVSATSEFVEVHLSQLAAPLPAVDGIDRNDITVRDITFVSEDGHIWTIAAANQGANYRGDGQVVNHTAVWCNGDRLTVHNVHSVDFENTVYLSPWNTALASMAQDGRRADCKLRNISSVDQFTTVLALSTVRLRVKSISKVGYVSAYANPGHAFYHSGSGTANANYPAGLFSVDLVAHDLSMVDDTTSGGGTVSLKYVRGGTVTKLYARNNPILYSTQLDRVKIDHLLGVDMVQPDDVSGQTFCCVESANDAFGSSSTNVDLDNVRLQVTSAHAGGGATLAFFHGTDINIGRIDIDTYADSGVATTRIRDVNFWGDRIRVDDLRITNLAANDGGSAIWPFDVGSASGPGSLEIRKLSLKNWRYAGRVYSLYVTDLNIGYNPADLVAIDNRATTPPFTSNGGTFSNIRLQLSDYTRELSITGTGQTVIPSPALETATQINVTTADAFTIGAPSISSTALLVAGTTHRISIRNATAGVLGAGTWNAGWVLRGMLVSPPAGETHTVTFVYNGTTWRETSRSQGAVSGAITSLSGDSLTVGEIVPTRRLSISSNAVVQQSGQLWLTYFTADKTETINEVYLFPGAVAAGATPTLIRVGIYSVAANGDITMVGSTANDTALPTGTNSISAAIPLQAAWNKVVGLRYAAGPLVVSGAAMPTWHGTPLPGTNASNSIARLGPPVTGRVAGLSDLPASVVAASVVGIQGAIAVLMTP